MTPWYPGKVRNFFKWASCPCKVEVTGVHTHTCTHTHDLQEHAHTHTCAQTTYRSSHTHTHTHTRWLAGTPGFGLSPATSLSRIPGATRTSSLPPPQLPTPSPAAALWLALFELCLRPGGSLRPSYAAALKVLDAQQSACGAHGSLLLLNPQWVSGLRSLHCLSWLSCCKGSWDAVATEPTVGEWAEQLALSVKAELLQGFMGCCRY